MIVQWLLWRKIDWAGWHSNYLFVMVIVVIFVYPPCLATIVWLMLVPLAGWLRLRMLLLLLSYCCPQPYGTTQVYPETTTPELTPTHSLAAAPFPPADAAVHILSPHQTNTYAKLSLIHAIVCTSSSTLPQGLLAFPMLTVCQIPLMLCMCIDQLH